MFSYVESMRRIAFPIMVKTNGARKKDNGEGINDAYPLNDLVRLLCFEDADDAREACQHYGIKVREVPKPNKGGGGDGDSHSDSVAVIFWKASEFRESKCPKKGNVLHLQPRKKMRTIEVRFSIFLVSEASNNSLNLSDFTHPAVRHVQ